MCDLGITCTDILYTVLSRTEITPFYNQWQLTRHHHFVDTNVSTIRVAGDLFECLEDLEDYTLWQANSEDPETQAQNRLEVLKCADWIVPGHGRMFQVPKEHKRQLKMVLYQDVTVFDGTDGSHSSLTYSVIEETDWTGVSAVVKGISWQKQKSVFEYCVADAKTFVMFIYTYIQCTVSWFLQTLII